MTTFAHALPPDLGSSDLSRCADLARIANLALGEYITGLAVRPMPEPRHMTQAERDRSLRMAIAQAVCSFRIARKAIENELIRAEATIAALTLSRSIAHEQGDVRRFHACDAALREAREDFRIYSTAKERAS
jgi:hypothetical protein